MTTIAADEALVNALADLEGPFHRPTALQWIGYTFARPLPEKCRTWVLHDVTCPTWLLRHAARALTLLAIPALIVLLMPIGLDLRLLILANAGLPSFLGAMLFALSGCEGRLVRAGYPAALHQRIRNKRSEEHQITSNRARRERIAERRARRFG